MELLPRQRHSKTSKSSTIRTFGKRARQCAISTTLCIKKSTNGSKFRLIILGEHRPSFKMMSFMKFSTIWTSEACG